MAAPEASPLRPCLEALGAVFGQGGPGQGPLHFGDASAEYDALTRQVGVVDFAARTQIELAGADRAAFLHNMCTNEVRKLPPGSGCEAFLTDARAHILAHVLIFCRAGSLVLETVPGQEQRLVEHLERYLIREQVELGGRWGQWAELVVAGPKAVELLAGLVSGEVPVQRLANVAAELNGCAVWLARVELTPRPGFFIGCRQEDVAAIWQAVHAAGAVPCGDVAVETARIEAGWPHYGRDITDKNLPQEVGRDQWAISFTKGCYIGQETVARIDALGHVNKTLVGVRFSGSEVPTPGAELTAAGHNVGQVTSAAYSPRTGSAVALAYVRRGSNIPGTALGSPVGDAEVVKLPM